MGPFPLLDQTAAERACGEIGRLAAEVPGLIGRPKGREYWNGLGSRYAWYKSLHIHVPAAEALATSSALLDVIASVIGPRAQLWGGQWVEKAPGESHRWHADVECLDSQGVTVWLALRNSGPDSGIKFIAGSHRFPTYPQALRAGRGLDLGDDASVLRAARTVDPTSSIVRPIVPPGSFVVFDGKLWHSTFNQTQQARVALIFQFSPTGVAVRVPTTFLPPIEWHSFVPPVLQL